MAGRSNPVGCIIGAVMGLLSFCVVGGIAVWQIYRANEMSEAYEQAYTPTPVPTPGMPGAPAVPGMPVPTATPGMRSGVVAWDGQSTLLCTGNDSITVSNVVVNAAFSPAIQADGLCVLNLLNANVTAPVVIVATGASTVNVTGGSLTGSTHAVEASGTATVNVVGASATGGAEVSGLATVNGVQ